MKILDVDQNKLPEAIHNVPTKKQKWNKIPMKISRNKVSEKVTGGVSKTGEFLEKFQKRGKGGTVGEEAT